MAVFTSDSDDYQRLDWALLQSGACTLYLRPEILAEDVAWLRAHGYRVDRFDCSTWTSEAIMHDQLASQLNFPDYYGRNLDAFNDCLCDLDIPEQSGRVLILDRYDRFAGDNLHAAWSLLDVIKDKARMHLLFGRRLLALLRSDDPRLTFEPVGANAVTWNRREWLKTARGLLADDVAE